MFIKRLYEGAPSGELIYSQAKFIADEKKFLSKHRKGNYIKHLFDEVRHDLVQDSLFERHDNIRLCRIIGFSGVIEFREQVVYSEGARGRRFL